MTGGATGAATGEAAGVPAGDRAGTRRRWAWKRVLFSSSRLEKIFRWIVLGVCLVLGAELVWLLGITPFMPFSRIDAPTVEGLSREQLLAAAGLTPQSSFLSVDTKACERALRAVPQVESARVIKRFPDRLEIVIQSRRAVGLTLVARKGTVEPVVFDASGVIFRTGLGGGAAGAGAGDAALERALALPLISGLEIPRAEPGERLPSSLLAFLKGLETVRASAPELLAGVSEIAVLRRSFDGFDLMIYPVHRKIRVRLSELNEDLLRYTLLMVDILSVRQPEVDTIDFRSGVASYTVKEGTPEY